MARLCSYAVFGIIPKTNEKTDLIQDWVVQDQDSDAQSQLKNKTKAKDKHDIAVTWHPYNVNVSRLHTL